MEPLSIKDTVEDLANSYINYGRSYHVDTNVKVKNIGMLDGLSRRLLKKYHQQFQFPDDEHDNESFVPPTSGGRREHGAELIGMGEGLPLPYQPSTAGSQILPRRSKNGLEDQSRRPHPKVSANSVNNPGRNTDIKWEQNTYFTSPRKKVRFNAEPASSETNISKAGIEIVNGTQNQTGKSIIKIDSSTPTPVDSHTQDIYSVNQDLKQDSMQAKSSNREGSPQALDEAWIFEQYDSGENTDESDWGDQFDESDVLGETARNEYVSQPMNESERDAHHPSDVVAQTDSTQLYIDGRSQSQSRITPSADLSSLASLETTIIAHSNQVDRDESSNRQNIEGQYLEDNRRLTFRVVSKCWPDTLPLSEALAIEYFGVSSIVEYLRSRPQDQRQLKNILTFTGDDEVAEAISCQDYLLREWPEVGQCLVECLDQLMVDGHGKNSFIYLCKISPLPS